MVTVPNALEKEVKINKTINRYRLLQILVKIVRREKTQFIKRTYVEVVLENFIVFVAIKLFFQVMSIRLASASNVHSIDLNIDNKYFL